MSVIIILHDCCILISDMTACKTYESLITLNTLILENYTLICHFMTLFWEMPISIDFTIKISNNYSIASYSIGILPMMHHYFNLIDKLQLFVTDYIQIKKPTLSVPP